MSKLNGKNNWVKRSQTPCGMICGKYTRPLQSHGSREFTFLLRPRLLCNCMDPNQTHMFWSCSKIQPFWDHIHVMLCKVQGYKISQTCIVLILGHIVGSVHNEDYFWFRFFLLPQKKPSLRTGSSLMHLTTEIGSTLSVIFKRWRDSHID